jgi:hypothetical protein
MLRQVICFVSNILLLCCMLVVGFLLVFYMGILDVATCCSYLCISLPLSASLMSKRYDTMRGECCTRTLASICKYNIDHIYEKGCSIQRMQHSEKVLIYNIRIELLQHHYILMQRLCEGGHTYVGSVP